MTSHNYSSIPTKGLAHMTWVFKPLPKGSRSIRERISISLAARIPSIFKKKVRKIDGDFLKFDTSPYISANFFRWRSQVTIDKSTDVIKNIEVLQNYSGLKINIFCHSDRFMHFINELGGDLDTSSWILFVGRGNGFFKPQEIYPVSARFKYVYMQHLLGRVNFTSNLRPMPTGIATQLISPEMIIKIDEFSKIIRKTQKSRDPRVILNFDISNNVKERLRCYKLLCHHPSAYIIGKESFDFVFNRMTENMFVASPPGAGPDCYRTWEAIYAGAVPIVLKHAFPDYKEKYPVWIINDWSELLNYTEKRLRDKYFEILNTRTDFPETRNFYFY